MTKKIVFPIISAFLAIQSYQLVFILPQFTIESWWLCCFVAWIMNMILTGAFAIVGFVHPTYRLLPSSYYTIHQPERLRWFYRVLGVSQFRQFLLATIWRSKDQRSKYFNGKRSGMSGLIEQSMRAEFGHLLPFILLAVVAIYWSSLQLFTLASFTMLWNIAGNLYPTLLQRHHRMRIQRIYDRQRAQA